MSTKNIEKSRILAPLRGVTVRAFRKAFTHEIKEAGFTEAITPFITATAGFDPIGDRELKNLGDEKCNILITPQFIGKDPIALRDCLERIKSAGFTTADLNCGCPFPMVRRKGRGSGLLQTHPILEKMIATGCEVMGEGRFSIKTRIGVDRNDELLKLMPMINSYPLRFITVHARTARQMYDGSIDFAALDEIRKICRLPLVPNGDIKLSTTRTPIMIGRDFVRSLGDRNDTNELLKKYIDISQRELFSDHAVLGRMKELIAYWKDLPRWNRIWPLVKITRTIEELRLSLGIEGSISRPKG